MYSYIFKSKLKQLNPHLYVREDAQIARNKEHSATGIYTKNVHRENTKSDYNYLNADAAQWLEAKETGNTDTFITACPSGWIPEYDTFDIESGRVLAKGWRTIVLHLVKEKHCSLERAQRIFTSSLGEHTWDRAGFEGRLSIARKAAGWKSVQEQLAKYL